MLCQGLIERQARAQIAGQVLTQATDLVAPHFLGKSRQAAVEWQVGAAECTEFLPQGC